MERYLTVGNLAERYQVSERTIWRWAATGEIPQPVTIGGKLKRWRESTIVAWEKAREEEAERETKKLAARKNLTFE